MNVCSPESQKYWNMEYRTWNGEVADYTCRTLRRSMKHDSILQFKNYTRFNEVDCHVTGNSHSYSIFNAGAGSFLYPATRTH